MSGIILPSGLPATPAEPVLTDEQREALDAAAAKLTDEDLLPKVRTAFAIVIDRNGGVSLDPSLVKGVLVDKAPSNDDIIGALAILDREIQTNISAMKTVQLMTQQATELQAAHMQKREFSQVQQALNLRGGR